MEKSRFLLFAIFLVVGFSSCKKDNWDNASFRCKINGEEYVATEKFATATLDINTNGTHILDVSGTRLVNFLNTKKAHGEMRVKNMEVNLHEIGIEKLLGIDAFYFGNNHFDKTIRNKANTSDGKYIIDGFDEAEKKVTGRFGLTAYDDDGNSYEISEGFFDVKYSD